MRFLKPAIFREILYMQPKNPHCFSRYLPRVKRNLLILLFLLLPLTGCGRYKTRKELLRTEYFAEILKRENSREIGSDGFLRDNLMNNGDPDVRRWCAIAFGRIADARALPILYGALHAGDAETRAAAAFAVGEIEDRERVEARCTITDPRAVLEITRLLGDSSISVRMRAIEALGKMGSRAESSFILSRMERLDYSRSPLDKAYLDAAITALARIGDQAAIPFLERLEESRDPGIRERAASARLCIQTETTESRSAISPQVPGVTSITPCASEESSRPTHSPVTDLTCYAISAFRENSTFAQIETTRGTIEIELFREDAPVTAERFALLATQGVYNNTEFTKTAPFQILQGGRAVEGSAQQIATRSEVNMRPFDRGRVGMAFANGASDAGRFFITLAPQPYLDGINTCFGYVVSGMQVADRLASGDRILRITIKDRVFYNSYQRY
jgi:peptidyl-prolyl cis-trans isomerase B (cyclophilin B)